jgi:hypothetical protein
MSSGRIVGEEAHDLRRMAAGVTLVNLGKWCCR